MSTDDVTEDDLLAFVDGQLAPERRALVEEHLARHPPDAARIAADCAIAKGLRLLFGCREVDASLVH